MRSMNQISFSQDRRSFLRSLSLSAAFFTVPGAFAEALVRTPPQTEGPFYPDRLPLDTDNDLIVLNDSEAEKKFTIQDGANFVVTSLKAGSVATFVW